MKPPKNPFLNAPVSPIRGTVKLMISCPWFVSIKYLKYGGKQTETQTVYFEMLILPNFQVEWIYKCCISYESLKSQDSENIWLGAPKRFFSPQKVGQMT